MHRRNLIEASPTFDPTDPEGFRSGMLRLGPAMGAQLTGATMYEIPPGEALCPYHYEYGEEEWLLVLAGRPTVRTPEGAEQLAPNDLVFFPRGPVGAHQVRNDGDETVRVLMWSNVTLPTVSAYPDSGKVGVWTGDDAEDLIVERAHGVGYYHGEA
ncbi:MAG TPA: cupin domain-containing protein [Solirubrobacteraceae bacterium]|nr:cupin domain-containing protein [Solirubrobacteraceae bacterium]